MLPREPVRYPGSKYIFRNLRDSSDPDQQYHRIWKRRLRWDEKITSLTAGDSAIIRCYLNPTVTGAGTPVTPSNVRPANVNAAVSTVTTGPTVSGNGTLVDVVSAAALTSGLSQLLEILDPGQTMLITLQASASSATTSTIIGFYEI